MEEANSTTTTSVQKGPQTNNSESLSRPDDYSGTIKILQDELRELKKVVTKADEVSKTAFSLVTIGWFALLLVVIGLAFSYAEFIYSGNKNDDYKHNLSEKVTNTQNEIKNLKICLNISKWLNPKCLEN